MNIYLFYRKIKNHFYKANIYYVNYRILKSVNFIFLKTNDLRRSIEFLR